MSVSSLFFVLSCLGFYKLGGFNARHPGQIWEWTKTVWGWMSK